MSDESSGEHRWTLAEVQKQEEALEATRARIAGLEADEKRLSGEIASGLADGEDVTALQAQRADARMQREDLSAAAEVMASRIEERRGLALQAMAEGRLQEIKKQLGGNAGEHPRRIERLSEAQAALLEELEKVAGAYRLQEQLVDEATALAARFDLEMPGVRTFRAPARDLDIGEILGPIGRLRLPDKRDVLVKPGAPKGVTGEILRLAGPRPPTPQEEAAEAKKRAQKAKEQAEADRFLAAAQGMSPVPLGHSTGSVRGLR